VITATPDAGPAEDGDATTYIGSAGLERLSVCAEFTAPETYGFLGRVVHVLLGSVGLSLVTSTEFTVTRTRAHVNQWPMRSLIVTLVLDGHCRIVQGRHQVAADPGELLARLSDNPYVMTVRDNTTLVEVVLPVPDDSHRLLDGMTATLLPDSDLNLEIVRLLLTLSTYPPAAGTPAAAQAERGLLELGVRLRTELDTAAATINRRGRA